ncbi:hypothetical protein VOLCADRAFT_99614 [Volvox carteri f. nagariensis]|uniref:Uncharacterized protein n=1 Tax=Volvox carteri f. nagariensis TaxID=3068 RepID=D8UI82_VOLCA|nr:uncharacterized protein VOLCADRAFT_99614 [Volvox carteri f. nagariensis]EFJ40582.1 hypothetical protein VOLCADRAFT_99614 [Volvox carteri f. nagariensis]|eukprot:XP_002958360.1 hypothetical protein VOLCADRAFT_99614 [Volvox carteri f. nagariensis]
MGDEEGGSLADLTPKVREDLENMRRLLRAKDRRIKQLERTRTRQENEKESLQKRYQEEEEQWPILDESQRAKEQKLREQLDLERAVRSKLEQDIEAARAQLLAKEKAEQELIKAAFDWEYKFRRMIWQLRRRETESVLAPYPLVVRSFPPPRVASRKGPICVVFETVVCLHCRATAGLTGNLGGWKSNDRRRLPLLRDTDVVHANRSGGGGGGGAKGSYELTVVDHVMSGFSMHECLWQATNAEYVNCCTAAWRDNDPPLYVNLRPRLRVVSTNFWKQGDGLCSVLVIGWMRTGCGLLPFGFKRSTPRFLMSVNSVLWSLTAREGTRRVGGGNTVTTIQYNYLGGSCSCSCNVRFYVHTDNKTCIPSATPGPDEQHEDHVRVKYFKCRQWSRQMEGPPTPEVLVCQGGGTSSGPGVRAGVQKTYMYTAGFVTVGRLQRRCMFLWNARRTQEHRLSMNVTSRFRGRRDMRTMIMTEAPPLALARFLSEV